MNKYIISKTKKDSFVLPKPATSILQLLNQWLHVNVCLQPAYSSACNFVGFHQLINKIHRTQPIYIILIDRVLIFLT